MGRGKGRTSRPPRGAGGKSGVNKNNSADNPNAIPVGGLSGFPGHGDGRRASASHAGGGGAPPGQAREPYEIKTTANPNCTNANAIPVPIGGCSATGPPLGTGTSTRQEQVLVSRGGPPPRSSFGTGNPNAIPIGGSAMLSSFPPGEDKGAVGFLSVKKAPPPSNVVPDHRMTSAASPPHPSAFPDRRSFYDVFSSRHGQFYDHDPRSSAGSVEKANASAPLFKEQSRFEAEAPPAPPIAGRDGLDSQGRSTYDRQYTYNKRPAPLIPLPEHLRRMGTGANSTVLRSRSRSPKTPARSRRRSSRRDHRGRRSPDRRGGGRSPDRRGGGSMRRRSIRSRRKKRWSSRRRYDSRHDRNKDGDSRRRTPRRDSRRRRPRNPPREDSRDRHRPLTSKRQRRDSRDFSRGAGGEYNNYPHDPQMDGATLVSAPPRTGGASTGFAAAPTSTPAPAVAAEQVDQVSKNVQVVPDQEMQQINQKNQKQNQDIIAKNPSVVDSSSSSDEDSEEVSSPSDDSSDEEKSAAPANEAPESAAAGPKNLPQMTRKAAPTALSYTEKQEMLNTDSDDSDEEKEGIGGAGSASSSSGGGLPLGLVAGDAVSYHGTGARGAHNAAGSCRGASMKTDRDTLDEDVSHHYQVFCNHCNIPVAVFRNHRRCRKGVFQYRCMKMIWQEDYGRGRKAAKLAQEPSQKLPSENWGAKDFGDREKEERDVMAAILRGNFAGGHSRECTQKAKWATADEKQNSCAWRLERVDEPNKCKKRRA